MPEIAADAQGRGRHIRFKGADHFCDIRFADDSPARRTGKTLKNSRIEPRIGHLEIGTTDEQRCAGRAERHSLALRIGDDTIDA